MSALAELTEPGTIPGMTRQPKPPKKTPKAPPNRTPARTFYVRLDPDLSKAFDDYVAGLKPKSSITANLELAIQEYLERRQAWPPADDAGEDE